MRRGIRRESFRFPKNYLLPFHARIETINHNTCSTQQKHSLIAVTLILNWIMAQLISFWRRFIIRENNKRNVSVKQLATTTPYGWSLLFCCLSFLCVTLCRHPRLFLLTSLKCRHDWKKMFSNEYRRFAIQIG